MSFVTLGGDGATRPTFFELVAAERLMPSLKAAISYSISVLAQHRPWLHRILDYEDECFALVCAALDKQSLAHGSATFAESLYGLRRATRSQRLAIGPSQDRLSARKQQSTVLTTVGLCYLSAKLHTLFQRHRTHVDTELGLTIVRRNAAQPSSQVYPDLEHLLHMQWTGTVGTCTKRFADLARMLYISCIKIFVQGG